MNLYLLENIKPDGWDIYLSFVIVAPDTLREQKQFGLSKTWPDPSGVSCRIIGVATDGMEAGQVVISSFKAG